MLDCDQLVGPKGDMDADEDSKRDEFLKLVQSLADLPNVRIAILSGWSVQVLKNVVGRDDVIYVGSHGVEVLYPDQELIYKANPEKIEMVFQEIKGEVEVLQKFSSELSLIDRGLGLALDFKEIPGDRQTLLANMFLRMADSFLGASEVEISHGKSVVELLPYGFGKVWAVRELVEKFPPEAVRPVYIGDRMSDDASFACLKTTGVTVLVSEYKEVTSAEFWLRNEEELVQVLSAFVEDTLGGGAEEEKEEPEKDEQGDEQGGDDGEAQEFPELEGEDD